MADNTQLSAAVGTGDVLQTDDLGSYKIAASKITLGANNSDDGYVCAANPMPVADAGGSLTVDNAGTFAVQAAQSGTWTVQPGNTANTTAWLVTGTGGTFPITAASLPLPSGASTAAKQPALGTAGTPSADVLTMQGIAGMTALKVDGSAVTQPVSGSVTANQGGTWNVGTLTTITNVVHVDDNAGSLTVDGTVAATQSGTWNVGSIAGAITPGTAAANLGKAEDAAHASGDTGVFILGVRNDTRGALAGTDGDYIPLTTNSSGDLRVDGSAVTQPVSGTIAATQSGNWSVRAQDGTGNSLTSAARGSERALSVQIVDGSGSQITSFGGSGGTASNFGSADPASGTAAGFSDGTNMREARVFDADSGAGTQYVLGAVLRKSASGGSVEAGTSSDPLRTDPTGTTAQPVTDNAGSLTVDAPVGTPVFVRLSDGAAAITNLASNVAQLAGTTTDTNSGNKSAGTLRVVLATDQPQLTNKLLVTPDANSAINVAQVGGSNVVTAATGVQKVGIVGNGGATVDATIGAGTAPTNQVVVGSVYNTSAPAPTAGQAMAQQADQAGNLRTAPGIATATLSAWNSGTALNATQTIFTNSGAPAVLVQLVQTSTLTAGAVTFEVSYDGSNWVTISADAVIDPTSTTQATVSLPYTVQASTNKAFLLLAKGAQAIRAKLSTQITGTGTVTPNYALLPCLPVHPVILGAGSATIGSLAANQSTNVAQVAGTTTDTNSGNKSAGTLRVVLATDQPQLTNKLLVTPDANSAINNAQVAGTTTATGNGTASAGCQRVTIASDNTAFSVNAAQSGTWTVQPGNTANTTPWLVSQTPPTSGGLSISRTLSAANTTGINAKSSAGQVYGFVITNTNASARFVKLYNKASAPTVGTDTPVITLAVPGNASGAGMIAAEFTNGIAFGTGIGYGITTGVADNDTGAPAANEVIVNLFYK